MTDSPADPRDSGGSAVSVPVGVNSLVSHLVDQAVAATATSERLSRLLVENNAVVDELSLPSLHRRIVEAGRNLVPTSAAALAVLNEGLVSQVFHVAGNESYATCVSMDNEMLSELTQLVGALEPGRVERLPAVPGLSAAWSRGVVAVPVPYRREVLAVLLLVEDTPGLTAEDEAVLLTLAVASGTALENARLYEEARLRQNWTQEAAAIGSGDEAMAVECEAIRQVSQSTFKLADAELVAAWVGGSTAQSLEVDAAFGAGEQEVTDWVLHTRDELVARALRSPIRLGPVELDELASSSGWAADLVGLGLHTAVVLPVPGGKEPRGLLLVGRHRGRPPFTPLELDLAVDFVSRAAVAMDRMGARLVEQRLSVLEDRERIASDLHDHVIQRLFATGLGLQSLAATARDERARSRLGDAVSNIDDSIWELRSSIFQLNTEDRFGGSLQTAVLEVLQDTAPLLGFQATLDVDGPIDSVTSVALHEQVLAVVREAVTNAAKHAQADVVGVALRTDGHSLTLEVVDNGIGLGETKRRSGLANLRRRARRLGGSLHIAAPVTGGTGLSWVVPLSA